LQGLEIEFLLREKQIAMKLSRKWYLGRVSDTEPIRWIENLYE